MSKSTHITVSKSPIVAFVIDTGESHLVGIIRQYFFPESKQKPIQDIPVEYEKLPSNEADIYLPAQAAAKMFKLNIKLIYDLCNSRKIVAYKEDGKNGKWWIREHSLREYLEKTKTKS